MRFFPLSRHSFSRLSSPFTVGKQRHASSKVSFEPPQPSPEVIFQRQKNVDLLKQFRDKYSDKLLVISGAGISTESGHPDYRSPKGAYSQGHQPATFQQFNHPTSDKFRKRYWLRSYFGFPNFSSVPPNAAHQALANWEKNKLIAFPIITQNVDKLHTSAGSQGVVELHGNLFEVVCLSCDFQVDRMTFQDWLFEANPFLPHVKRTLSSDSSLRPDGDVLISDVNPEYLKIPPCPKCSGVLKPNVTFFGESIPKTRTQLTYDLVDNCDAVLCLGSSLEVFSAFRLVRKAKEKGAPVAVVTIGPTRADDLIDVKIEDSLGALLPQV